MSGQRLVGESRLQAVSVLPKDAAPSIEISIYRLRFLVWAAFFAARDRLAALRLLVARLA